MDDTSLFDLDLISTVLQIIAWIIGAVGGILVLMGGWIVNLIQRDGKLIRQTLNKHEQWIIALQKDHNEQVAIIKAEQALAKERLEIFRQNFFEWKQSKKQK